MKSTLKTIAKKVKNLASDYYYKYKFYQEPHHYLGVFKTFDEALKGLPKKFNPAYNDLFESSLFKEVELGEKPQEKFNDQDYPVIFWLRSILNNEFTLLDFGGNLGLAYYSYRKYLDYPDNFQWIVVDLPDSVKAGKELAKKIDNSEKLSFTSELKEVKNPDILLTCGALQYIEKSLAKILDESNFNPQYIIVQRVPFYEGEEYITLQNLGSSAVPYKIQNRTQFIKEICALGYELIDSWKNNRTCFIPFHPECFVEGYHGFYFRKKP